jgi:hypothetical protein
MGLAPNQLDVLNLGNLPKISEIQIDDGLNGNIQTIDFMKQVARVRSGDPLIRKLALNILQQYRVPSHYYLDEARAVGDFVKNTVRYVRDPNNIEYLQDPIDLIKQIQSGSSQGDCDDMAMLTATLLLSIGHEPYFRAVRYVNSVGNYNHIYVVDYDKNPGGKKERLVIDCILKGKPIGFEVPHVNGDEYEV